MGFHAMNPVETAAGVEMITSTPKELREYIVIEIRKYRDIIQRAGIRAN